MAGAPQNPNLQNPNPQHVNDFHNYDDLDLNRRAHHHTLGYGVNQAAPGKDVDSRIKALATATPVWIALPPNTGWSAITGYETIAYCLDVAGFICLKGALSAGGTVLGGVITTIPNPYRPKKTLRFPVVVYYGGGASTAVPSAVTIDTLGQINIEGANANNITIDGIRYDPNV